MSALGQKRTSEHVQSMSALPPKADIRMARITFGMVTPVSLVIFAVIRPAFCLLEAESGARTLVEVHCVNVLPLRQRAIEPRRFCIANCRPRRGCCAMKLPWR